MVLLFQKFQCPGRGRDLGLLACVAAGILLVPTAASAQSGTRPSGSPAARASQQNQADWIAKARQAELLLMQDNGIMQALAAYEKLEQEVPNQPPLALRMAQLADQMDNSGLALFHYRRYLTMAGARARQEARDRAATLELNPAAREVADRLARERKVQVKAAATPVRTESSAVMAALGEGEEGLVELKGKADFERLSDPAQRAALLAQNAAKPRATASTAVDDILVRTFAARTSQQQSATQITDPRATRQQQAPHAQTLQQPIEDAATLNQYNGLAPLPGSQGGSMIHQQDYQMGAVPDASVNPQIPIGYEPRSFEDGQVRQSAQPSVRRGRQGTIISDAGEAVGVVQQNSVALEPRQRTANSAGEFTNVPPQTVSPRENSASDARGPSLAAPMDPRQRFFTSRASTDGKTRLRLANNMPDTIMTIAAVSESSSEKADAILATGESRVVEISPAAFEIRLTIMSIGYPSSTLLDRRFRMRFNAGTEYSVRLTPDLLTRIN
jgi:hypothetical protein